MEPTNKVALVTGAGRGIGRATALAFAREGVNVVVNYLRSREEAEETVAQARQHPVQALALQADVSHRDEVDRMFAAVRQEFGRLDVLVNNAAVFSRRGFFEIDEALWDRVLGVNLKGTFWCARAAAQIMLAQQSGVIVNFASGAGLSPRPGYESSMAYASSRAAVIMLTKRLALELAPMIRVNCVVPGVVDSKPQRMSEEVKRKYVALTPLKRVGEPSDIAAVVVFLASDAAALITGQTVTVDGGILMP